MDLISSPPQTPVLTDDGTNDIGWTTFFSNAFSILSASTQSGTTANRPVKLLWIGRTYFDTTLNRPIWYSGTNWIKSDGTVV